MLLKEKPEAALLLKEKPKATLLLKEKPEAALLLRLLREHLKLIINSPDMSYNIITKFVIR